MSNIQHDLVPDVGHLVIQGGLFLVAVVAANYYLIKPALRLHNERKKRTSGAVGEAKSFEQKAELLESDYNNEFRLRLDEAKSIRTGEITAAQSDAEKIIKAAQLKSEEQIAIVRSELQKNIVEERKKLPSLVDQVADIMMGQLGAAKLLVGFLVFSTAMSAYAAGGNFDVMEGIVWPYFQFIIFASIVVYFGKKVVHGILESRRDDLRVKLTESKQALVLAQNKASEFETKLKGLQKEVDEMRLQYMQDGERERQKIINEAQTLATQLNKDAERTAREMVARSKEELRRELIDMAAAAVEKRLTPDVTKSLDKKLNAEAVSGIQKLAAH